jgi:hypothetical protein
MMASGGRQSAEALPQRADARRSPIELHSEEEPMLFLVIERFRGGNAAAVYRRLRDQGRLTPEGLTYLDSWVAAGFDRCFQLMECNDVRLVQQWVARWNDLVEFEIVPVTPSADARAAIAPLL